jgi:anaerobic dimethyl sulfoxide reductase subunit B (iron-sulfur subunit)
MQIGFYFDQARCTGCYTCVVACKDWHDVPAGTASWVRVTTIEEGKYPNPSMAFLAVPCFHCAEPACVEDCPAGAITKRTEDGIVVVNREECLGQDDYGRCLEACPYDAPQFGAEENAGMQKCDLCLDRWIEGKPPICVAACPTRALDAGPLDELKTKYGNISDCEGFVYEDELRPSVVFRPKAEGRPVSGNSTFK